MKKDRIIIKFLITLAVTGCVFGLAFGVLTAKAKSSHVLEGVNQSVITESEIAQFIRSKFYP